MKATIILPILAFLSLLAAQAKAQDIVIMTTGDTLSGKVMGVIQTGSGAAEWLSFKVGDNELATRLPMSEVSSYRVSGNWVTIQSVLAVSPPVQKAISQNAIPSVNYSKRAATGFGIAGGFFLAGGVTLIVSSALAEKGELTSTAPFYIGYGMLLAGGVATIGGAISLGRGAKDRLKVTVGGVPVN
jgi:hypothetical protein